MVAHAKLQSSPDDMSLESWKPHKNTIDLWHNDLHYLTFDVGKSITKLIWGLLNSAQRVPAVECQRATPDNNCALLFFKNFNYNLRWPTLVHNC